MLLSIVLLGLFNWMSQWHASHLDVHQLVLCHTGLCIVTVIVSSISQPVHCNDFLVKQQYLLQTFRALAEAPDTVVLVRAVFHLSSPAFQLTAAVVSQFPELSRLSFQCKVQCTTFILTDTPPATELHNTSTSHAATKHINQPRNYTAHEPATELHTTSTENHQQLLLTVVDTSQHRTGHKTTSPLIMAVL